MSLSRAPTKGFTCQVKDKRGIFLNARKERSAVDMCKRQLTMAWVQLIASLVVSRQHR